ncbi:MAG: Pathogenesis-related transcriptional factor and ERF protein [Flavobacteriales bacterium]|nr:Pathogenesis-related transcriptional factor and ERF protein [Flavobacteriales bacterium]
MVRKIQLQNRKDMYAVVDDNVYQDIANDERLSSFDFLKKLRAHSNGYAFFQRYRNVDGVQGYETIYLHRYIAEKYIEKPKSDKKLFVRFIDGDCLNATIENLEWVPMGTLRRNMKNRSSTTGFRGVTIDRGKYRAVLYSDGRKYDLGFFDVPEEAAKAYNRKSMELFGETVGLNRFDDHQ